MPQNSKSQNFRPKSGKSAKCFLPTKMCKIKDSVRRRRGIRMRGYVTGQVWKGQFQTSKGPASMMFFLGVLI